MYKSYNGVFQNLFLGLQNNSLLFFETWFVIQSKLDHDLDEIPSR